MSLISHCIAVHATDILPKNGVMVPGSLQYLKNKEGILEEFSRETYRQTLHWSLNQIAPQHEGGNWSQRKMAILTPLNTLSAQLVNIAPLDTFVLGEVKMDERFTLVAEDSIDTSTLPEEVNVVRFNPQTETLLQAVASQVQRLGGAAFTARESEPDIVSVVDCASCNAPVTYDHFHSLFDQYPRISYGDHMRSVRGEAWRFGQLERIFENFTKVYIHAPSLSHSLMFFCVKKEYDAYDMRILGQAIDHHLIQLETSYGKSTALDTLKTLGQQWKRVILAEEWFQGMPHFKTFQMPENQRNVDWIKTEIMEKDLASFNEEEKQQFLTKASRAFYRTLHYEQKDRLGENIGIMLNGDSWNLLRNWQAEPRSFGYALLTRWYLTGNRSDLEEAHRAGKVQLYKEMLFDYKSYQKKSLRPDPVYAERAKSICNWIADFIHRKIETDGKDQFIATLKYWYKLEDKTVQEYLDI